MSADGQITIIRGGAIGDFVLTLPAIQALRSRYPDRRVQIVGNPTIACLARPELLVDHSSASLVGLYRHGTDVDRELHSIFCDSAVVLAYTTADIDLFTERLSRVARGPVLVHDPRPDGSSIHISEQLFAPLRSAGFDGPVELPRIELTEDECRRSRELIGGVTGYLALHPGSGGHAKCWPWEHYGDLIERAGRRGLRVVVVLGPADEPLAKLLPIRGSEAVLVARPPDLRQLAGLLKQAALYLGNDSGPSHIAAAVGIPTVALFGPTDPRVWGPRGHGVEVLRAPDGKMESLEVDSVEDTLVRLMDNPATGPAAVEK